MGSLGSKQVEVTPRVFDAGVMGAKVALDIAARQGVNTAPIARRAGLSQATLRDAGARMPWAAYLRVMADVADALGGMEAFRLASRHFAEAVPEVTMSPLRRFQPMVMMRFICEVIDPLVYPAMRFRTMPLGGERYLVRGEAASDSVDADVFWQATAGGIESMPLYLARGLGDVRWAREAHGATYELTMPPSAQSFAPPSDDDFAALHFFGTTLIETYGRDVPQLREEAKGRFEHLLRALHSQRVEGESLVAPLAASGAPLMSALQHALDVVDAPLLVLDEHRRVLCLNHRATELLEDGDLRLTNDDALTARDSAVEKELAAAFHESTLLRGTTCVVQLRRAAGPPVSLLFVPLSGRRQVMLTAYDPLRSARISSSVLRKLYGLTTTESDLAAALVAGQSLLQFAIERGTSEGTARVHMKRVLAKTGAAGQVDLVRTLLAGGALQLVVPQ